MKKEFTPIRDDIGNGKPDIYEYTHNELNNEVRFISGYYLFDSEVRTSFEAQEVFYLLGYAVLDTACCGSTGCGYALVNGFVKKWKFKKNSDGHFVSLLSRIHDQGSKLRIQEGIIGKELVQQVVFR